MRERDPAFSHHLHEVSLAESEAEIPPDAKHNDFAVEVTDFEQIIEALHFRRTPPEDTIRSTYMLLHPFAPEPFARQYRRHLLRHSAH